MSARVEVTLAVTYPGLLGGAERTLVDFAGGLPGELVLACPEGPLAAHARAHGMRVFPIGARRLELRDGPVRRARAILDLAGHGRELRRLARDLDPDLVLAWGMRSAIVAPWALRALDPRPALLVRHVDFLPGPLIARLMRAAVRCADSVSVNSRAVALDLDPFGELGPRLSVVSPGVDLASYCPEWRVGADREALLLGTLMPWKRPDLALEAVALAAREVTDLRLTVAGTPMNAEGERLTAALRERAQRPDLAGRVYFAEEIADHRDGLRRAWCLLHCADREPFGNVIVEALAAGRPVVAPAAGGPAEVIDDSCGRLYAPGEARAAAAALVEVLACPERARRLGSGARERAARHDAGDARRRFAEMAREGVGRRGDRARVRSSGTGMALVTVTHNSAGEVDALLRSVRRHLPQARTIVVDSGSSDDSAAVARAADGQATVVELGHNLGFGRASNEGVRRAEEPVCVLINPDAELIDSSLGALAAKLRAPDAPERLLAPLVLSPDGSRQDSAQLDPADRRLPVKALVPPALLPAALRPPLDPWRSERPRRIGWAVGSCIVARTETLRRLGPFDERIFLFAEDLDLGLRAAEAGIETWFCPEARVLHADAHSTAAVFAGEPFHLLARQRRAVVGERRGVRAAQRDHWTWLATYANRLVLKALSRRPTARERFQLRAEWAVRREPARLPERPAAG